MENGTSLRASLIFCLTPNGESHLVPYYDHFDLEERNMVSSDSGKI